LRAPLSFAALLLILRLADGGQALAGPIGAVAMQSIGGVERVARGPAFAAEDLLTRMTGSLSKPRFDPSAGIFGSGGIQTEMPAPDNLSGTYTALPAVHDASASVMVADGPDGADGFRAAGGHAAPESATQLSPRSTAASGLDLSASAGRGAGSAAALETADIVRDHGSLVRSSVFLGQGARMHGRLAGAGSAGASSATALATVGGPGSLTVYQALRAAGHDPRASARSFQTIESYSVAEPASIASTAATVRMPIRVAVASYGFLSSSLTVFSDDFGTFAGIGQTFNGLTSLDIAEPASVLVVLGSLAGIAAVRRRRL
jgi:hypothetical protein